MNQQQREITILSAKIKAQIFRQIFKDLNQKYLEGVEYFFVICSNQAVQLQFLSESKHILITIVLMKDIFAPYIYNIEKKSLHKYRLQDFMIIGYMFENNKMVLEMELTQNNFILSYRSGSEEVTSEGRQAREETRFVGQDLRCSEDDEELLIQEGDIRPEQQNFMKLKLERVNIFEGILRYARLNKIQNIFFHYNSIKKKLQVSDKRQNPEIKWGLKIQQIFKNNFNSELSFNCNMLNCAINLLNNDHELILTFYPTFLLMDVPEKQKSFTIRINANRN